MAGVEGSGYLINIIVDSADKSIAEKFMEEMIEDYAPALSESYGVTQTDVKAAWVSP